MSPIVEIGGGYETVSFQRLLLFSAARLGFMEVHKKKNGEQKTLNRIIICASVSSLLGILAVCGLE